MAQVLVGECVSCRHHAVCELRFHKQRFKLGLGSIRNFLETQSFSAAEILFLARELRKAHHETGFWVRAVVDVVSGSQSGAGGGQKS